MLNTFDHKYQAEDRRLIFVPTALGRSAGERLHKHVLKRWRPPPYFYHFREGGHVAAARAHIARTLFMTMDLHRFYDRVTRTKVHRAMRKIGYGQRYSLKVAGEATVSKPGIPGYSLPFGFVQSPVLASLVLDCSELGQALRWVAASGCSVSVFMDDFVVASDDEHALRHVRAELERAGGACHLPIHPAKGSGPSECVRAFNIEISHGRLAIAPDRMDLFRTAVLGGDPAVTAGILSYVGTVCLAQHAELAVLATAPSLGFATP